MRNTFSLISTTFVLPIAFVFGGWKHGLPKICPHIITKNEWGGRGATQFDYSLIPLDYVIIHHTLTPECHNMLKCSELLKSMQNYHMEDHGFYDIAYNFLIGGDGFVYEGRGWHKVGSHTKGYNSKSLGIAFIGKFTDKLPNAKQLKVGQDLIRCAKELQEISSNYKLYGARQLSATLSPGLMLYHEIRTWPNFNRRI